MFKHAWKIAHPFLRAKIGSTHVRNMLQRSRAFSSKLNRTLGLSLFGLGSISSLGMIAACDAAVAHEEDDDRNDIHLHRPPAPYQRIDSLLDSTHPEWRRNNAFHGTLRGENMIEDYEVYFNPVEKDIICLVRFGSSLNGHEGIVHGGITAMTFDNSFGWLFLANKCDPAFTANIHVNYRQKVPANSLVYLKAKFTDISGRKLYMGGTMEDVDGNVLADATCLFITVKNVKDYKGGLPASKKESTESA